MSDLAGVKVSTSGLGALTGTAMSTVSGGQATVEVGGTTVTVNVARDLTLATGDVVLLVRQGSMWWCTARLFTTATTPSEDNDPAPPPKPAVVTGLLVVPAVTTRSYRDGKWRTDTDDVLQGEYGGYGNSTGCAFYGSKPRSLTGATVTRASIRVKRLRGGTFAAQTTTLRLVTESTRPAGAPTLDDSTTGPSLAVGASDTSFTIPTAWAQEMVDGTAGGLAIHDGDGSPYVRLAGKAAWPAAFTLTIAWRR